MELENQLSKTEGNLKRKQICNELWEMYELAEKELSLREVKINFSDFTSHLVTLLPPNTVDKFVEAKTPPEFLLKEMLNDPMYKDQLIAFSERLRSSKQKK